MNSLSFFSILYNYEAIRTSFAKSQEIAMFEMKTWMLLTWATKASAKAISLQHGIRQIQAMAPTTRDQRCNFVGCQVPGYWIWVVIGSMCCLLPIHRHINVYIYIDICMNIYICICNMVHIYIYIVYTCIMYVSCSYSHGHSIIQ